MARCFAPRALLSPAPSPPPIDLSVDSALLFCEKIHHYMLLGGNLLRSEGWALQFKENGAFPSGAEKALQTACQRAFEDDLICQETRDTLCSSSYEDFFKFQQETLGEKLPKPL